MIAMKQAMRTPNAQLYDKGGYLVMAELPAEQQAPFRQWIIEGGQTQPVLEQEGAQAMDCAYMWDYERWYSYWSAGQAAPIWD